MRFIFGLIMDVFKVYFDFWRYTFKFSGRASWMDYWVPVGIHFLLLPSLLKYIDHFYSLNFNFEGIQFHVIPNIIWLILLMPTFSCGVRRLHDMNYKGFWNLFSLMIPLNIIFNNIDPMSFVDEDNPTIFQIIFTLIFLVCLFMSIVVGFMKLGLGTKGPNRYGPSNLEIPASQSHDTYV